ncbi:MAG: SRPBCC domain-containing protein [Streptosporangiaceae bacterium]
MAATVTLPCPEEILLTREFDAPPHLVYRAWTEPDLVRRWWTAGQDGVTAVEIEIDLRPGGTWRYAMVADDGEAVAFCGQYREVLPDQRLVYTEVKQDRPDMQALTTVTFTGMAGGRTTVSMTVRYDRQQDRDVHRAYMGDGLDDAMDLLERVALALGRDGR